MKNFKSTINVIRTKAWLLYIICLFGFAIEANAWGKTGDEYASPWTNGNTTFTLNSDCSVTIKCPDETTTENGNTTYGPTGSYNPGDLPEWVYSATKLVFTGYMNGTILKAFEPQGEDKSMATIVDMSEAYFQETDPQDYENLCYSSDGSGNTVKWSTKKNEMTFQYWSSTLVTAKISTHVTTLCENCFKNNTAMTTVEIPSNIKNLNTQCFNACVNVFPSENGLQYIHIPTTVEQISYQAFDNCKSLKDVYIDVVKDANGNDVTPEIKCSKGAFDQQTTYGGTDMSHLENAATLHYPPSYYDHYVYNYNGVLSQADLNNEYKGKTINGWQEFVSSGMMVTERMFRTYSDVIAHNIPTSIKAYLVTDFKDGKLELTQLVSGEDVIPSNTGVILYSTTSGLAFLSHSPSKDSEAPYNQFLTNGGAQYKGNTNYLMPMARESYSETIPLENVEIVNGEKTFRNFFMTKYSKTTSGKNAGVKENSPADYWGFFRVYSKAYAAANKAYLHFPVSLYTNSQGGAADFESSVEWNNTTLFAKGISILIDEEDENVNHGIATGINQLVEQKQGSYYTLQGVKVDAPMNKGIYIFNGKKVLVK